MYLSRLILNPRNAGARRDAARPYELHRTLVRILNGALRDERLLFRIEPEAGMGGPVVLVQTDTTPPDWEPLLKNGYLLRADGPKPFTPSLARGVRLRFRLVANPVKRINGKRIPLIFAMHADEQVKTYTDWLGRQAERWGFRVLEVRDAPFRTASNRTKLPAYEKHEIPHFGVRFDGLLEVVDPELLSSALRRGIGPAKAFGFGLLSLAPAS